MSKLSVQAKKLVVEEELEYLLQLQEENVLKAKVEIYEKYIEN